MLVGITPEDGIDPRHVQEKCQSGCRGEIDNIGRLKKEKKKHVDKSKQCEDSLAVSLTGVEFRWGIACDVEK